MSRPLHCVINKDNVALEGSNLCSRVRAIYLLTLLQTCSGAFFNPHAICFAVEFSFLMLVDFCVVVDRRSHNIDWGRIGHGHVGEGV